MAIILALVITGWLIAFALGAQTGFDHKPVAVQQSPKATPAMAQIKISRDRVSAA